MLSSKLYYAPWEGLLMDLIQQFIDTYKMKWTFYDAAGRLAAEKLQLALQNAGIRAIVTSRAKNPARLRTKVQRRNSRREEPDRKSVV